MHLPTRTLPEPGPVGAADPAAACPADRGAQPGAHPASARRLRWLLATALCVAVAPGTAHAYVDPGTGSYLVQIIIAGVLGALAMVRLYWTRITTVLRGLVRRNRREPVDGS